MSIHEQILTQIRLGVASRDLVPGEKLPSTRELARRFGIHANTVSAAYRELAAENLVEFRKGSGVFITRASAEGTAASGVTSMLSEFVARAYSSGFTRADIQAAMDRWLDGNREPTLLLVESDDGLRSILECEIRDHINISPVTVASEQLRDGRYSPGATIVALFDEREKILPLLDGEQKAVFIDANSVPHAIVGNKRPEADDLIAVVSCWNQFVAFARVYLIAAKIDPEALIVRSTGDPDWKAGLHAASIIICDSFTAKQFDGDRRVKPFRLITDSSLERIRHALM